MFWANAKSKTTRDIKHIFKFFLLWYILSYEKIKNIIMYSVELLDIISNIVLQLILLKKKVSISFYIIIFQ
jgi:hypothetical protein